MIYSPEKAMEIVDKLMRPHWNHGSWRREKQKIAAALLEAQAEALEHTRFDAWPQEFALWRGSTIARLRSEAQKMREG